MSDTPPSAPPIPAGWYADNRGRVRWWDSTSWTNKRAPIAHTTSQTPSNSVGLTGFVLACVAFAAALLLGALGVLFGLIGVVISLFGITERNRGGRRFAVAGTIISAASVCVGIFMFWLAWTS
jgi:hypothetical protein